MRTVFVHIIMQNYADTSGRWVDPLFTLKFAYCNKNQALRQLERLLNANLCDFSKKKVKIFLRILHSLNIVFDLPNTLSKTALLKSVSWKFTLLMGPLLPHRGARPDSNGERWLMKCFWNYWDTEFFRTCNH